jgi:hypothetical protein
MKRFTRWLATGAGIVGAAYTSYAASAWLRYGRPRKARGDAADPLLDTVMPSYDVCERHRLAVVAPADVTLAAAKQVELEDSRIIRAIFKARALILRGQSASTPRPTGLVEGMKSIGWGVLAEVPDRELVMGAVTKPWEANPVFRPLPPEDFARFADPDHVKISWTLRADPTDDGGSVFRTETRAVATDPTSRKKFRRYWSLLSPGIIAIRSAMLPAIAAAAHHHWRLEGDDIIPVPRAQLTHAIAIDAPATKIWPWLLQMGCQRGGWYSWDILDNAGLPSADRINPDLQQLQVGDILPARPRGQEGFTVLRIVPERALVVGGSAPRWEGTWAFVLEPLGRDRTRLVTRYRAGFAPSVQMSLMLPVLTAAHAVMERKQLRTIKHHAEQLHGTAEAVG